MTGSSVRGKGSCSEAAKRRQGERGGGRCELPRLQEGLWGGRSKGKECRRDRGEGKGKEDRFY